MWAIRKKWSNSVFSVLKWYDYAIVIAVYVLLMLIAVHTDIFHTAKSSFAILEGHLADFYQYNEAIVGRNDYDILVYLIFAAWSVPLFIAGVDIPFDPIIPSYGILYEKILVVTFVLLSAWALYKVVLRLGVSKRRAFYGTALFITMPSLLLTAVAYGMYDIIYLFFMLWGMYFFINEDKKRNMWLSALFFGLSFAIKPLAAFAFVPMVLYRHKKFSKSLPLLVVAFAILLLVKMPYMGQAVYTEGDRFIDYLFGTRYFNGRASISIFFFVYALLCMLAYHIKYEEANHIKTLYIALVGMAPLYLFSVTHPQWFIIYVALFSILTAVNQNKKKLMVYDGVFSVGLIAYMWVWGHFLEAFTKEAIGNGFFGRTFPMDGSNIVFFGEPIFPSEYMAAYLAVMLAGMFFVMYCLNPWKFGREYESGKESFTKDRTYLRVHMLVPVGFFLTIMIAWMLCALV